MQLQERLRLLQVKQELLDSVFGPEKSDGLQDELSVAVRNRELLHTQLLQRKSRLQVRKMLLVFLGLKRILHLDLRHCI